VPCKNLQQNDGTSKNVVPTRNRTGKLASHTPLHKPPELS
jgi:hypothetical protein